MVIVIAILTALAIFVIGVIAEEQRTEAKGCNNGIEFNASGGRCSHG